jgi:ElaB/YqjD/DUF883 family membrane-anchored ribosome-binding protein
MKISEEQAQEVTLHERRIEQTRGQMTNTVSELQDRLSPGAIAGSAGNTVKDATAGKSGRFIGQMAERIKQNPVPAALVGAGLAWMMWGGKKNGGSQHYANGGRSRDYYARRGLTTSGGGMTGPVRQATDQVSNTVGNAADQVASAAANVADQVSGTVSNAADTARTQMEQIGYQAQQVPTAFQQFFQENPLPVALAAAGVGALIATAMPTTDAEQRIAEPVGQQLQQQAKALGDKVGKVADEAQDAAKKEAQRQNLA